MKPRLCLGIALSLLALSLLQAAELKFTTLFNGKDLTGWTGKESAKFWRVEQGVLVGQNDEKKTGNMLWTEKSYGDFVFECDVRWNGDIDSGVMLRKPELQVQFGTSSSLKIDMTGSFYVGGKDAYPMASRAKDIAKVWKAGDWNTVRIEAKGTTFTVSVNGQQMSQLSDAKYAEAAPIGLQVHPNKEMKVEYRNVRVATL
jgi:hypothetical protein